MLDTAIATIVINIASSIIYDFTKKTIFYDGTNSLSKDDVQKFVKENIKTDFFLIDEMQADSVLSFLNNTQITDIIRGYVFYMVTGELRNSLKTKPPQIQTIPLSQNDIISYISDNYIASKSDSISSISSFKIDNFLSELIKLVKEFYHSQLKQSESFIVFAINERNDRNVRFLSKHMDYVADRVIKSLKYDISHPRPDYNQIKQDYEKRATEKLSRAHIYLLDYFDFNKFYVPPRLAFDDFEATISENAHFLPVGISSTERWKHIFDEDWFIYVVGGAGYGKSLFIKNIILNVEELNILGKKDRLIIQGDLKNFVDHNGEMKDVISFLQDCLVSSSGMSPSEFSEDFVRHYFNSGKCIILLDALDEVREDKRNDVHSTMRAYFRHSNPNNKICITSRSRGFIRMHDNSVVFHIMPLTFQQIEKYVDNIINLGKFDASDKNDLLQRAKPLVEKGFLSSCLILSLLVNIYKAEKTLPDNKLELYQKCFEYISYKREVEEHKHLSYNWDKAYPLMTEDTFTRLAQLCAPNNQEVDESQVKSVLVDANRTTFGTNANAVNAVGEFLKFCANRTELFVPGTHDDTFKFFHRSFLDYFYALHIFNYISDAELIYEKLQSFGLDSEIYELLLTLLKNKKRDYYNSLVELVFEKTYEDLDITNPSFLPFNILILFMQEITESTYEDKFVNILFDFSIKLTQNGGINIIDSNHAMYRLIMKKNTRKYANKFNMIYKSNAITDIANNAQRFFDGELKNFGLSKPHHIYHWILYTADRCSFYTSLYIRLNGVKRLIDELKYVNDTSKYTNISKNARKRIMQVVKSYDNLSDDDKKELESAVFRNYTGSEGKFSILDEF